MAIKHYLRKGGDEASYTHNLLYSLVSGFKSPPIQGIYLWLRTGAGGKEASVLLVCVFT